MTEQPHTARDALHQWQAAQRTNVFLEDHQLQRLLERLMAPDRYARSKAHFEHFGAVVMGPLDDAAIINNETANLPRLQRWSAMGDRIESVAHHPSYHQCGHAIYEEGRMIATYADGPAHLHALALFYLSSHVGEAGHNCPIACTAGIVKALSALGSQELKSRYLPGLLSPVYAERLDGAQFLTELQGGSDVGANAVMATPDGDAMGTTRWRIHGEKWFCSNAEADLILMTARVEGGGQGTRGLGLFLVPRLLEDGSLNHFRLRRLKDKLGTRSMASAEIDFDGTIAYALGPVGEGFIAMMRYVIQTSRLYNTLGCAGIARRARLVATSYARHREAFGKPIIQYPQVQQMVASIRARGQAILAGALEIASLFDAAEGEALSAEAGAFLRVATNLVKMRSAQHSHTVVLTAIETLGGNGAIESFSVLPRLLRDNVVYENWEGTHNTLVAQTLRDFVRSGLHTGFIHTLRQMGDGLNADLSDAIAPAWAGLASFEHALPEILATEDPGVGALLLRPHAERLGDVIFAVALARDVASEPNPERRDADLDVLRFFISEHFPSDQAPTSVQTQRLSKIAGLEG